MESRGGAESPLAPSTRRADSLTRSVPMGIPASAHLPSLGSP
jgi:hypothetical protein